ncbi:MAG: SagB/ThcOx family dehydrogenase [Deltaproteobacteria bacterium]|nr:SagB/ThcOx family dehydrogenase [Deltaproteobacteria bacterium]
MAVWKRINIVGRLGLVLGVLIGGVTMVEHDGCAEVVALPAPSHSGRMSVETALQERRSVREYLDAPMTLAEVSQLLWAAQGITNTYGYRTAPSAGALYPLEVYLVAGRVTDLPAGVYKYRPHPHTLVNIAEVDLRAQLASAALGQSAVRDGAIVLVLAAVYERTTAKYGRRGVRYVHMEVGHVAQNVYLQAIILELGTVFIGAFSDDRVKDVLKMSDEERPLGIMPIGRPR